MSEAYSIRESLQGALRDFVLESGIECVHVEALIRELVGLLAAYREEESPLFPEVFVFWSQDGLKALSPSTPQVEIGTRELSSDSASAILKDCAPLASRGWGVYVVKEGKHVKYGLFRAAHHSLATAAEESMKDLGKEVPVILIRNRGHLIVELSNTLSRHFTVALTTTLAVASPLERNVERFVEAAAARVKDESQLFRGYYRRLLISILQDCHGTLMAVVDVGKRDKKDKTLEDGVWPDSPLDFAKLHSVALNSRSVDSLADLQAAEALLLGMINSDGVVLFGDNGTVRAYRVFLKPNRNEAQNIPDKGGGRRRTFELMQLRLRKKIFRAVLFRSQDGETRMEARTQ